MTILQQPDVLSLSGNIAPFRINSASPVLFTLRQGSEEILSHRYAPGQDGYITIDIRDIVHARLSFLLQESSTVYVQPSLAATFTAVIDGTEVNFRVVRAGVDRLTDTTSNFLTQNFLSWQPSVKPVTYYSPEFLTYYAILPCKAKLRAYFTDSSGNMISQQDLELYTFASGNAYTIPLQYAIVAGRLGHKLPAYYDVWIENNSSERLTYIQRYYASDMRSEQEQWILFENSLGGIDTFRAYGTTDFTGEHTHNIAEVEDIAFEYRVDTERKFQKNTGHLDRKERQWLLDFFPSEVKYIYLGSALRRIVVVESNVTYTDRELPSHYTFTYRYADARPLLNLPRTDIPTEVLNITVPEVGSFTVPPRLVEFSRLPLTEGALFPVQQPYSEEWNTTTAGALEEYISNRIYEKYNAAWSKQIYLIRRNDKTPPTEENAYSALEADNRFLTKEEVPDSYFTKKRSPDGQEYLHTNYPLVLERYAVFGHGDTPYLPSMFEEIPLDQQTLGWKDGLITVLKGGGSDFDELAMWGALGKEGVQQIDKSHLSGALTGYATEKFVTDKGYITSSALTGYATETFVRENFVTLAGAQEITGEKDFTGGLKVNGGLLDYDPTERVWKLNGNMLISGNITFGWDNGTYTAPTLLDLLPYDPATLSKEGGRLSVIGSAGSSFDESAMWTALLKSGSQQIDKSHLDTALAGYATENFVNTNLNALKGAGLPTTEGYRNVTEIANTLLTFLTGSDTDSTINKWKELEAFLAGFSETDTLATALSVKADKTRSIIAGTGLSGGGDLSADRTLSLSPSGIKAGTYTKLTVDAYGRATSASGLIASDIPTLEISKINGLQDRLNTFVTLAGAQEITGEKNFTGGLKVNGGLLDYDPTERVWKLDGNLLITGSTTWNAVGDYTAPTLLDLLPYDPATLSKEGGRLSVIGGGGSIGGGNIMLNGTLYEAANGVITLPDLYQKTPNGTASQFLKADGSVDENSYITQSSSDSRYVLKIGDKMTGPLIIDVPNISSVPSINSPTKIGFKENGAQEVAFAYTDFDSYRAPAGIKLVSTENEPWFEAPWILCRKLNISRVATEYSAGTGAVINYFGTDTIMDNQSSSVTGTMKIQLPVSWTNTMGVYKIMLYEYNGRGSSEITVSFYNYSSSQSYYNYSYQLNGAFEGSVRVAYDGSGCCILLGNTSYNWNYIKAYVYQVFNGQNVPSRYVDSNYNISIITSESGLSKITSVPKTSMNKHDTNYIRALNKNGYYGMGLVGDTDNAWIRTTSTGLIPYKPGTSRDNSMLGSETWQFGKIYGVEIFGQRVASLTHNLYLGSSGNSGWVYCQDICSANGAAEAYWSIRTNGTATFTNLISKNKITGNISGYSQSLYHNSYTSNANQGERDGTGYSDDGITYWRGNNSTTGIPSRSSNAWGIMNLGMGGSHGTPYQYTTQIYVGTQREGYIAIRSQHGGSLSPWFEFYTQRNANKNDVAWTCAQLHAYGRINANTDIWSNGWVRTNGANGWYSETYGGGWHMTDTTWLRAYDNKQIYTGSTSPDAIHTAGGINASGRIYAGGIMENAGGLNCHGIVNSSGANGFNVYAAFYGRSDHGGIEIGASDNVFGIGVHSNDHMYWWWTNSGSIGSSTGKSYIMDYGGGNWSFTGNHYVSGYSTWGSDSRYKTYLGEVTLQLEQIADSPTIYYRWNSKKRDRDGLLHVGGYAQYIEQILPELTHETSNFKTMDYAVCAYVYAVHAARFLRDHLLSDYEWKSDTELRIHTLEKENIKLKKRIKQLERRVA